MSFSPFAILTAEELNDFVENINSLADGSGITDGAISYAKLDADTVPSALVYSAGAVTLTTSLATVSGLTVSRTGNGITASTSGVFTVTKVGLYRVTMNMAVATAGASPRARSAINVATGTTPYTSDHLNVIDSYLTTSTFPNESGSIIIPITALASGSATLQMQWALTSSTLNNNYLSASIEYISDL